MTSNRSVSDYVEGMGWYRIKSATVASVKIEVVPMQHVADRSHSLNFNRIFGNQPTSSAGRWMQRTSRPTSSRFSSSSESRMCITRNIRTP